MFEAQSQPAIPIQTLDFKALPFPVTFFEIPPAHRSDLFAFSSNVSGDTGLVCPYLN